jgi:hypothetical protein
MMLVRFTKECPGLAGSLGRLYGKDVVAQFALDYCEAADLGGNVEFGVAREEGVSFNPRIARVVSLVMQDCDDITPHVLRVAAYSAVPLDEEIPADLRSDVSAVRDVASESPEWIKCIALALMLDRARHLHMADIGCDEKERMLASFASSALLAPDAGSPENLRLKLIHSIDMQRRRLHIDRGE